MSDIDHTFIIPAYKDSAFLESCIISLTQQTLKSKILITTSTPSLYLSGIADKYNIEIKINETGEGIASDWNFAYKNCETKYLTLAHQDDLYLPDYAEQCIATAEKPENIYNLIIFSGYTEFEIDKPRKTSVIILIKTMLLWPFFFRNNIKNKFLKRCILAFGNPICCPSVMFNIKNIGPFQFSEEYRYNIDWEAWLQLAKKEGKFIYIKKKLMIHRLHKESQTSIQIQSKNRLEEEKKIFKSLWNRPIAGILMQLYKYSSTLNIKR